MDIFARLDKLEDFIANSKRIPLSSSVAVNEAEFYDLLDDVRATLPNELKQARLVSKERDRIVGEAQRKEEELLAKAEKRADSLVQQTEIVKQAELERDHMLEEASEEARRIIYDAEDVADRIFGELEASLIEVKDSTDEILNRITSWREKLRGYAEQPAEEEYDYEREVD
ncbi:MAG: ATPase [Candidatus Geothermincolia bacterium]